MSTLKLQKKIFFADDDKSWTDAMTGLLALRNVVKTKACNEASKVISEALLFEPDILLVDLRWDKATLGEAQNKQGHDILTEIQEKKLFPNSFIAALTQELQPSDYAALSGKWNRFHIILKSDSPDPDLLLKELKRLGALKD